MTQARGTCVSCGGQPIRQQQCCGAATNSARQAPWPAKRRIAVAKSKAGSRWGRVSRPASATVLGAAGLDQMNRPKEPVAKVPAENTLEIIGSGLVGRCCVACGPSGDDIPRALQKTTPVQEAALSIPRLTRCQVRPITTASSFVRPLCGVWKLPVSRIGRARRRRDLNRSNAKQLKQCSVLQRQHQQGLLLRLDPTLQDASCQRQSSMPFISAGPAARCGMRDMGLTRCS